MTKLKNLTLVYLAAIAFTGAAALAECFGPLCNKMHDLDSHMDCITGQALFAGECDSDANKEIPDFKAELEDARKMLMTVTQVVGHEDEVNTDIDNIEAALDKITQAKAANDANTAATVAAQIAAIQAIEKDAHSKFRPHPGGPGAPAHP